MCKYINGVVMTKTVADRRMQKLIATEAKLKRWCGTLEPGFLGQVNACFSNPMGIYVPMGSDCEFEATT